MPETPEQQGQQKVVKESIPYGSVMRPPQPAAETPESPQAPPREQPEAPAAEPQAAPDAPPPSNGGGND